MRRTLSAVVMGVACVAGCGPGKTAQVRDTGSDAAARMPAVTRGASETPTSVSIVPFAMAGGDAGRTHRTPAAGPKRLPRSTATFDAGSAITTSVVVAPNGMALAGTATGTLLALKQGAAVAWIFQCSAPLRGTPAVSQEGMVLFGCDDKHLFGVTIRGEPWFAADLDGPVQAATAVGADGTIYTADRSLVALAPGGHLKWKALLDTPVAAGPTITAKGAVVVGADDHRVYAFDRDGTALWSFGTDGPVRTLAAALADGDVLVGSADGAVYRLSGDTGGKRWSAQLGAPIAAGIAVAADDSYAVVAARNGALARLALDDGRIQWRTRVGDAVAAPLLDSEGRVYVGGLDGFVYAVRADDGAIAWRADLGAPVTTGCAVGPSHRLLCGTDAGLIHFLESP